MPGPKSVSIRSLRSSMPSKAYSSSISAVSNVEARAVPLGMAKAIAPLSIRIPLGPSEQQPTGTPISSRCFVTPPKAPAVPGVTFGEHIPSPRTIAHRSSSESCAIKSGRRASPFATSVRRIPVSPVYGSSSGILSARLSAGATVRVGTISSDLVKISSFRGCSSKGPGSVIFTSITGRIL